MNGGSPGAVLTVAALAALTYAMRSGGYLAAALLGVSPGAGRLLRAAPGNLFVAVACVSAAKGGWPILTGSLATMAAMQLTSREWLALPAGAGAAALTAYVL